MNREFEDFELTSFLFEIVIKIIKVLSIIFNSIAMKDSIELIFFVFKQLLKLP